MSTVARASLPRGRVRLCGRLHGSERSRSRCHICLPSAPRLADSQLGTLDQALTRTGSAAAAHRRAAVRAHAAQATTSPAPEGSNTLRLAIYFALWYAFSVAFNIVNKSCLTLFPMPWFISTWQLGASGLFVSFLWLARLHPRPELPRGVWRALLPVAFFHCIGHVAACVSFSKMAVSFTHVVKASEPAFTVALSGPLQGALYPAAVWLSLAPIIAGTFIAACKEVTFDWWGFNFAMASNWGMVLRGIYSKQCLRDFEGMDGINLFGLISITSLVYCVPAALYFEGGRWPAALAAAGAATAGPLPASALLALSGLLYHLYNQLSYMVLSQGVSPVTWSVGNTMKRVAIIVASVLYFRNPVSPLNWLGSALAVLGAYCYSVARVRQGAR